MITLFLMGKKGFKVLQSFCSMLGSDQLDYVISDIDTTVDNDYFEEIRTYCTENSIKFFSRREARDIVWQYAFAVGWRRIISNYNNLIILHDSILPKYRGFAPVVTALLNNESEIGVTALFASKEYDQGNVIEIRKVNIEDIDLTIEEAIELLIPLYCDLVCSIAHTILNDKPISSHEQDHSKATYSLWRDEEDYRLDWSLSISDIARFIRAVGLPYKGAAAYLNGQEVRILSCEEYETLCIENHFSLDSKRCCGKVFRIDQGFPIVVCKDGLLRITKLVDSNGISVLPLKKLKSRFI